MFDQLAFIPYYALIAACRPPNSYLPSAKNEVRDLLRHGFGGIIDNPPLDSHTRDYDQSLGWPNFYLYQQYCECYLSLIAVSLRDDHLVSVVSIDYDAPPYPLIRLDNKKYGYCVSYCMCKCRLHIISAEQSRQSTVC